MSGVSSTKITRKCGSSLFSVGWPPGKAPLVVLCLVNVFFIKLFTDFNRGCFDELKYPRSVFFLVEGVQFGIVGGFVGNHAEDDFK